MTGGGTEVNCCAPKLAVARSINSPRLAYLQLAPERLPFRTSTEAAPAALRPSVEIGSFPPPSASGFDQRGGGPVAAHRPPACVTSGARRHVQRTQAKA